MIFTELGGFRDEKQGPMAAMPSRAMCADTGHARAKQRQRRVESQSQLQLIFGQKW